MALEDKDFLHKQVTLIEKDLGKFLDENTLNLLLGKKKEEQVETDDTDCD